MLSLGSSMSLWKKPFISQKSLVAWCLSSKKHPFKRRLETGRFQCLVYFFNAFGWGPRSSIFATQEAKMLCLCVQKTGHHQQDPSNELCLPNAMEGECFWQPKKRNTECFRNLRPKDAERNMIINPRYESYEHFDVPHQERPASLRPNPHCFEESPNLPDRSWSIGGRCPFPPKDLGPSKESKRKMAPNRLLRSRRNSGSSKKAHRC